MACLPVPIWLDFMGQPMAERQLLADVYASDDGLRDQWTYVLPSLLAGDRFSACSERQRFMLLGELGATGRLNRQTAHVDLVSVLQPFHLFDRKFKHTRDVLRGICVRADDFVVLWSGGYNTWTDVDTLFEGLERAMAQHPKVVFVSTGGAIPGHDDRTFSRFRQKVESSPNKSRYEFCGWVPTEDVQNYFLESNAAVNVDRWSIEGEVGTRTRLMDWIMAGLPAVSTILCEFSKDLAERRFVTPFRIGDPQDLGIKLAALAADCAPAMERVRDAQEYLRETLAPETALARLAAWVDDPQPAPDLPEPSRRPRLRLSCPENSLARLHRSTLTSEAKGKRFWARILRIRLRGGRVG
jgi:glycosyltransferase involved in cell wall biosynthesis